MTQSFDSLYAHGMIRAAVCIPSLRVADPAFNATETLSLCRKASESRAALALFPELGISAYANDDLFHQSALLAGVKDALSRLLAESRQLMPVIIVGAPLVFEQKLFNCGVILHRGRVLGVVPKSYLPNYREFYEKRQFAGAKDAIGDTVRLLGQEAPFGADLVFAADGIPDFRFAVEICEDVWTPIPPSTYAAMAGALLLANLSASNITVGKAAYRRELCAVQSGRCIAAYLYSAAGPGESTTDLAWDGYALIYENHDLLAESQRFSDQPQMITADIDLGRLVQERMRATSFTDATSRYRDALRALRRVSFRFDPPEAPVPLARVVERFPFVPADRRERDARCYEAYNIQIHGLMKRMAAARVERIVIGVSGGLDSTQSLIVAARTMDRMGLPRSHVLAYTMPGFATSAATRDNAHRLMRAMGVTAREIDIRPSCMQMLADIGHPFAAGQKRYDVTFENVQAGERTSHLFRLANLNRALVLGTGDLSELALGWATYGVGDHMSHYNVNASIPKTLIQHLIRWVVDTAQFDAETGRILTAILNTEISPELVPGDPDAGDTGPAQKTEDIIGPYELQDFNLYYITRYGFAPSKVAFLAYHAWHDRLLGNWSDLIPEGRRNQYDLPAIRKWLAVFLHRFFQISQFKRSALPNGPKVGSGGSLSPRGDWRAPSDGEAAPWLLELDRNVPPVTGD